MVALGMVQRVGEHYQNVPVADAFLSGRTATDVRPILRQFNHLSYPKSECIRFVHSCGSLGLYFSSDAFDSGGDLWLLV
jgi:hypothetical protein